MIANLVLINTLSLPLVRPLSAHISLERSLINDSWPANQLNSAQSRVKSKLNNAGSTNLNNAGKANRTKLASETTKPLLQLVDDQPVEIYCEVIGSRPASIFSWYLGDQKLPSNHYTQWPPSNSRAPLTNALIGRSPAATPAFSSNFYSAQLVNSSSNKTASVNSNSFSNSNTFASTALISNQHLAVSTLHFKPTAEADGKQLTCRAENTLLTDHRYSSVEAAVQLDVQCKLKRFLRVNSFWNLKIFSAFMQIALICISETSRRSIRFFGQIPIWNSELWLLDRTPN